MFAIVNARLVLEDGVLENGILLLDGNRIVGLGDRDSLTVPGNAVVLNAGGGLVGPGFVDIHCHGGGGHRFDEEPTEAARHFLRHGTTTVLPTLYTDIDKEGYLQAIDRVRAVMEDGSAKNIGGFYMEGPYTNEKFGSNAEKNRWRGPIRAEDYEAVVERAGTLARVWVVAPEREGIEPFLQAVNRVNPGVTVSVGHSMATPAQIDRFKKYGLRLLTHATDATGRAPCPSGTRNCGPDEACFLDDGMYAEVICDSLGIHVNPDMLKLILKIKTVDKVILISDSTSWPGIQPPEMAHVTDLSFDGNGDLSGSKLALNQACRNMIRHTGISVTDAFLMASRNPARVIGIDDEVGTLAVGKKANVVILDDDFNVKNVILEGELVC